MWLLDIFEREFGFSDVQSNYSRVYAWMANQLGHMTLGLATVLFFVWISETMSSFAGDLLDGDPIAKSEASASDWFAAYANHVLLWVAALVMAGAALLVVYVGTKRDPLVQEKWDENAAELCARYFPINPFVKRCIMFATACGAAILVGANWPHDATEAQLAPFGAAAAVALFALAVATLCADWRYAIIGGLAMVGVWWIATDGGGFTGEARKYWGYGALLLFLTSSCLLQVILARPAERFSRGEAILQIVINFGIFVLFIIADQWLETPEWRVATAGFIASLTLWWTKEFASDLPNVHLEIANVGKLRQGDVLGDVKRVEYDYFTDARFDARTDGLFYFAGAWIGAGVASPIAILVEDQEKTGSWASGSEILGFIVFLIVFLWLGRNWAYRQLALDRMGANKASRLGVFHAALRMKALKGDKQGNMEPLRDATDVVNPLNALSGFADDAPLRGEGLGEGASEAGDRAHRAAQEALNGCDHIIIFGAPGSGRSPLGRAIASEAALSDYPTRFRERKRPPAEKGEERTARYISAARLLTYLDDIKNITHASETPTVRLVFADKKRLIGDETVDGAKLRVGADIKPEEPASMVVIDDVALADLRGERLDDYLAKVSLGEPAPGGVQKSVWLVTIDDKGDGDDADWEMKLGEVAEAATRLITLLAQKSRGDDNVRVGVGLTRRVARYGEGG